MRFTKMEATGNDYIYINTLEEKVDNPAGLSIKLSNRHYGIGSDGLVLIESSDVADAKMRMFNHDGSEGSMCGNASCCIGKYLYEKNIVKKERILLETKSGIKELELHLKNDIVHSVTVDMGEPILQPKQIPMLSEEKIILNYKMRADDTYFLFTCLSMGNPHAVTFLPTIEFNPVRLEALGKSIQNNEMFPEGVNVEFIEIMNKYNMNMRVWERGSGETLGCGTGACAGVVASIMSGYSQKDIEVSMKCRGGILKILWSSEDNHVYLKGVPLFVFDGFWYE